MTSEALERLKYLTKEEKDALERFESCVEELLFSDLVLTEVFGSKARGDYAKDSDIDVLLVVDGRATARVIEEAARIVSEISVKTGVLLSPVVLSKTEYELNRKAKTSFMREIERDGVLIYGAA